MKWRRYTSDDYVSGVPCVYIYRDFVQTVTPFYLGARHPFDGSRRLCFRFLNGGVTSRMVDGGDLTSNLYAASI